MRKLLLAFLLVTAFNVKAQTWQICNNGTCNYIPRTFIESSGILLAAGGCQSLDSGYTWSLLNGGIGAFSLEKNSAGIFAGSDTAIYFSNNNGLSWTNQFVTGPGNYVFGMAVLNDTVFATTLASGILMSPDNGISWTQVNSGLPNDSVYSILVMGNQIFAGMYGGGIFRSSNSGSNWNDVNSGLPTNAFVRSIASDGTNLYAAVNGSIFISNNNGTSWTQATIATASINKIFSVGNALIAGGFTMAGSEGIYRSLDNGITWTLFNSGFPINCPYGVGGFYATNEYIYCGIESQCGSIYRIARDEVISSDSDNIFIYQDLIEVFPNPFSTELNFTTGNYENSEIILFDITSRKILHQTFTNKISINTEQLAPALYLYEVRDKNGVAGKGKIVKN